MAETIRLFDGDRSSFERRVARAVARLDGACAVVRYTHWYTSRPPVYEAEVRPQATGREPSRHLAA